MSIDRFYGRSVSDALGRVREVLGGEALVLHVHAHDGGAVAIAATPERLEGFEAALRTGPIQRKGTRRARILALIGPTGSGKTTTIVKLALSDRAFGGLRVGVVTLDRLKIGAFAQIQAFADLAGFDLDILSHPSEVDGALKRMRACDVILVDTPGRGRTATGTERSWRETLAAIGPDETHLAIPASTRLSAAQTYFDQYASLGPTHILPTKLDEVTDPVDVAFMVDELGLPARWVAEGHRIPEDLAPAPERLVGGVMNRSHSDTSAWVGR